MEFALARYVGWFQAKIETFPWVRPRERRAYLYTVCSDTGRYQGSSEEADKEFGQTVFAGYLHLLKQMLCIHTDCLRERRAYLYAVCGDTRGY
jgi:hypothetical protein